VRSSWQRPLAGMAEALQVATVCVASRIGFQGANLRRMDTDCLFCGIASGEISASVVAETPRAMAFRDISPQAPVHVVVIPKDHHPDVAALSSADPDLAAEVLVLASQVAQSEGLDSGFRVVFNSGSDAGQSVFHVHAHVLGGRSLGWPPG